ncbi:hypothetical protein E4U55_004422 [Claviceps digitariae]|nr:hypothetical protein E4U55_004422 [Claviceps digitariae]
MKLATVAALLMAAVPTYASDYTMTCPSFHLKAGDDLATFMPHYYEQMCIEVLWCESITRPLIDPTKANQWIGTCMNCPTEENDFSFAGCSMHKI